MTITTPFPLQKLVEYGRIFPTAWRLADEIRAGRGKQHAGWPDWCFLPMGWWYMIICECLKTPQLSLDQALYISELAAVGAWPTQDIYIFDQELFTSIAATPIDREIPTDLLFRLPSWCVYIETSCAANDLLGFFVHLEYDMNTGQPELRYLLNCKNGTFFPLIFHIGPWSLMESMEKAAKSGLEKMGIQDYKYIFSNMHELSQTVVNLTLYLCSQQPDIYYKNSPLWKQAPPKPEKTKKGFRIFPPKKPRILDVGRRMGEEIRQAKSKNSSLIGTKKIQIPHIRRAHWHSYWCGPKLSSHIELRWIAPTLVNPGDMDGKLQKDNES